MSTSLRICECGICHGSKSCIYDYRAVEEGTTNSSGSSNGEEEIEMDEAVDCDKLPLLGERSNNVRARPCSGSRGSDKKRPGGARKSSSGVMIGRSVADGRGEPH